MTIYLDINEAEQQLYQLIDFARGGNKILITRDEHPIARLTAIQPSSGGSKRVAGLHKGAICISDAFVEPIAGDF